SPPAASPAPAQRRSSRLPCVHSNAASRSASSVRMDHPRPPAPYFAFWPPISGKQRGRRRDLVRSAVVSARCRTSQSRSDPWGSTSTVTHRGLQKRRTARPEHFISIAHSPAREGLPHPSYLVLRTSKPRPSDLRHLTSPSAACPVPCSLFPVPVRGVAAHGGGEGKCSACPSYLVLRTSKLPPSALRPPTSDLWLLPLALFLVPCSLFHPSFPARRLSTFCYTAAGCSAGRGGRMTARRLCLALSSGFR